MSSFEPRDPDVVARVRSSFSQQRLTQSFGAPLTVIRPGDVHIELRFEDELTHQGDATERIARMQATMITVAGDRASHSGS